MIHRLVAWLLRGLRPRKVIHIRRIRRERSAAKKHKWRRKVAARSRRRNRRAA